MEDKTENTEQNKPFKRRSFAGIIPVMFIYYCGYVCVTKPNKATEGSFFDTVAPYVGFACILLASVAALAFIFRAFKEITNKVE